MKIIVGSSNPTKIESVKSIFSNAEVEGLEVSSMVSAQPFSDEETLEGAINRARECANSVKGAFGIGLEGGVTQIENDLFLCNWGALVDDKGNVYIASGARIPLPDEISEELHTGKELGDVMDVFAKKNGVRKKEGAIGIFTNENIDRMSMFSHVVLLLKGQWEYAIQNSNN